MNSKSSFILLLICGIILVALVTRNGNVLLLAMPFLVFLVIGILECPVEPRLQVQRSVDRLEVAARQTVNVRISIENRGPALANLYLDDPISRGMSITHGQAQQRLALAAGETTQLDYAVGAERGLYTWNQIHATASDPCGLFETRRDIPASAEVRVRPAPMKLHDVPIKPRSTLHAPGPTAARLAGAGTDFWGIREYRPGDALRRLNWRLAGRYPRRLFTNEYEGQEIADVGFILDTRRLSNAREVDEALFESAVSAAASLSEVFLNKGNRVALLVFGETTSLLFPGYGKQQLSLVTRALANAALGPNLSFRYLEYFPARLFPSRSVIVSFSAVDARDAGTYARLRAFGYEILLISPNPVEYIDSILPPSEINGFAVRAARLERIVELKRLMKMGVGVIDWHVSQPLDPILQRTAKYMSHKRRM